MDEIMVGSFVQRHGAFADVGYVQQIEGGTAYVNWEMNDDDEADPWPLAKLERVRSHTEVALAPLLDKIDAALQGYIDADDDDLPIEIFELTRMIREKLKETSND